MHLTCPDCSAVIPAEDINIAQGIAKCRACNAVINVAEQVHAGGAVSSFLRRPPIPQPARITLEDLGDGLRLTRRWFTWTVLVLTAFCAFWDGFLVVWYWIAFSQGGPWPMVVFPVLFVVLGIFLTYLTLALYLNRSILELRDGRLTVRHGPLPWPGQRDLDTSDLEQLFCQEKMSQGRNGAVSFTYNVNGLLKGGQRVQLLGSLPDREQALFVEQVVEGYLGIEDRPVGGELSRP